LIFSTEQKPDQLLTDEDRELLQRWAKMQQVNPSIAPKSESTILSTNSGTSQSNMVPQTSQPTVISNPSQLKSFQATSSELSRGSTQQSNNTGKSLINVDTMHMLQQKLQARNSLAKETVNTAVSQAPVTNDPVMSNPSLPTINMEGAKMMGLGTGFQEVSSTVVNSNPSQILSSTDMGLNKPEASSSFQEYHQPLYSNQNSPQRDYSNHSSPESYQSNGSPDPYNQDSNSSCDVQNSRMTNFAEPNVLSSHQHSSPQQVGITTQLNQQFDVSATNPFTITSSLTQTFTTPFQTENTFSNVVLPNAPEFSSQQQFGNISNLSFARNEQTAGQPQSIQPYFDARYQAHTQPRQPNSYPRVSIDTSQQPQDLISVLTEQFSSTQVGDNFPPMLPLTPRGTGAGYGVGMDLDSLMDDSSR
jgi:hypothetical protein